MWDIVLKLVLAALIGFIIGMGNKTVGDPSGRVFSIVCVGSTLITITSMEFIQIAGYPWVGDPGRLAAQVISALGFIGTGFIWITDDRDIRGLSVASSLWVTAIVGMIIGIGLKYISTIVLAFLVAIYYLADVINKLKKR
ncbi:MAG TPA: hypothetical protein GX404_04600 [Syntrophomonadaceae bacterium]|jgi:putative Mg2+ transporter-C (MgtC) family protein|nr:hypothetical protein [Syntrophomonadaceae bacterium]